MPFEVMRDQGKRIAVIGGGISGLGAAHLLSRSHHVTLFEAEPRLGGHACTVMAGKNGDQPVDVGFIVFNHANYPYLSALFHDLGVPIVKSNMTFGASIRGGAVEYGLASADALFAQRRNLVDPRFWRLIRDVVHFNKNAIDVSDAHPDLTIGAFLEKLGTGTWFRDFYLTPFSGAIWSTPTQKILDFPAQALVQFFKNHALLNYSGQHQWYTVEGGSIQYVSRLEARLRSVGVDVRLKAPIDAVRRKINSAEVKSYGGDWESFDEVIFATHSDDTLRLLSDASAEERDVLGAIKYQPNDVVLHCDETLMPKRRKVWSSWVYTEDASGPSDRIDLSYWMNSLQPIPESDPHFVTLNTKRTIREDKIYHQATFRHPVYDLAALEAQDKAKAMNGSRNTWFCGAWMKNGFHEDGLSSAVDVVEAIEHGAALQVAAQ